MRPMYYIGLDVHKRKISYCVKDGSGPDSRRFCVHRGCICGLVTLKC